MKTFKQFEEEFLKDPTKFGVVPEKYTGPEMDDEEIEALGGFKKEKE